jgi:mRNA interferase HicA
MKRTVLIRRIGKAAKRTGAAWTLVRQGGNHEIWSCASTMVTIPRHREINELTAQGIMGDLEAVLGKGWWRK